MNQTDVATLPDGRHRADRCLFLEVRNDGTARSWLFIMNKDRKRYVYGLGSAYYLSLAQAKTLASEYKAKLTLGIDPRGNDPKPVKKITFKDVAEVAVKNRAEVMQWKTPEETVRRWLQRLELHVFPKNGTQPINDVTKESVLDILKPIWLTKPKSAQAVRQNLENIFDYAIRREWYTKDNPARWKGWLEFELPSQTKFHNVEHFAALSTEEARTVCSILISSERTIDRCILFGMLTATRQCEFVKAKWDEFDLTNKRWLIPPERRKDRVNEPFVVPLSSWCIQLLNRLQSDLAGRSVYLFPSKTNADKPICQSMITSTLARHAGKFVTMHGCRSTFRDWCAETGKDPVVAEKCLMHKTGTQVERAYQRSDLLKLRRVLMQAWGNALLKGKKV